MANDEQKDRAAFDAAIQALKAEVANAGVHLSLDSSARLAYARQIQAMANELQLQATSGRITWGQAAQQAQEARNVIMEIIRGRSTPVGRAMAQRIKSEGKTLNELIARKAQQLHGPNVRFDRLTAAQQNAVYGEIVKSAGKSNAAITQRMRTLSRQDAASWSSIAVSVYTIANADNKVEAAGRNWPSQVPGSVEAWQVVPWPGWPAGPGHLLAWWSAHLSAGHWLP